MQRYTANYSRYPLRIELIPGGQTLRVINQTGTTYRGLYITSGQRYEDIPITEIAALGSSDYYVGSFGDGSRIAVYRGRTRLSNRVTIRGNSHNTLRVNAEYSRTPIAGSPGMNTLYIRGHVINNTGRTIDSLSIHVSGEGIWQSRDSSDFSSRGNSLHLKSGRELRNGRRMRFNMYTITSSRSSPRITAYARSNGRDLRVRVRMRHMHRHTSSST